MSVRQVSAEGSVAPNLVPMVDVIFLMLLFLMVGADMGQRELEEVKLPTASSVQAEKPDADDGGAKRLTLNVYHDVEGGAKCADYEAASVCARRDHWSIGIRGQDYHEGDEARLRARLLAEAEVDRERRGEAAVTAGAPRRRSELKVMIRADRAALYELVQTAMNACGDAGIYRIEVGAASPLE